MPHTGQEEEERHPFGHGEAEAGLSVEAALPKASL